jgi:hypothetical protein
MYPDDQLENRRQNPCELIGFGVGEFKVVRITGSKSNLLRSLVAICARLETAGRLCYGSRAREAGLQSIDQDKSRKRDELGGFLRRGTGAAQSMSE